MTSENTTNAQLRTVIEEVRQEAAHLQVQGRPLSEAEKQRVAQIHSALPLLEDALVKLGR
jgi:hypothetical protein